MKWEKELYEVEKHPFETFIPDGAKYLIIGTFPTHSNNFRFNFFYSGKDNLFWNIMEKVFKINFQFDKYEKAVEERKLLLTNKKIGITDMHQLCYRKNNKSIDENLYPIILNDIFPLLDKNDTIEKIILTSRTPIVGALGLLKTYFLQKHLELPELEKRKDKIMRGSFTHTGKKIEILVPYSPSKRVIESGFTNFDELVEMYKHCLEN